MLNKRPNSYYVRLIALCFILTSLPVALLGILSYMKSAEVVRQKVNEEKVLSLQQTQLNVEQTLKVVDQATTHFLGSKLLLSALNEPLGPDQFQLFTQIKTELNNLQRLDTGISDIRLWSKPGNWLINNDGLFRLDAWLQSHPDSLPAEPSQPSVWMVSDSSVTAPVESRYSFSCAKNVNLIKKLPLTAYRSIGMAVLQIPACQLSEAFSVNADGEAVYIFNQHMEMILRAGQLEESLDASLSSVVSRLPHTGETPFELETQQNTYTVNYRVSEYNDWMYVSVVPLDQLNRKSSEIGWFTFYICLGLLVLFIILAFIWSKRLYRPIDRIVKDVMAGQKITVQAKPIDELSFIGEQVHTLFDARKRLESRLHGQTELLRTFFMIKLFLGGMKEEEIVEQLEHFGMRQDFSHFCVLAVQVGSLEGTRFAEKDVDLLLFAINNVVGELLSADTRLQPIVLGRTQMTVMTSAPDRNEAFAADAYHAAKRIRETLSGMLNLNVNIGISVPHIHITDIPRAHEEALEALKRRPAFGEEAIVRFADLGENHSLHYAYPYALQAELFNAIKLLERERVIPLLQQLLQDMYGSQPSPYDLQFHGVRLLMNLLGLANGIAGQAIPMQRQQSLFDELFNLDIPEAGENWFMDKIITPLISALEQQTEVRHLSIAKELVKMVHEEFDTDLSIDTCAERLHYNSSYISTIFRKSMDISFSAYLAQYRHQIALKWLKETHMPIKEIAEKLRYNNSQNFIRSFRKLEGVSPGKYRELNIASKHVDDTEQMGDKP